MFTEKRIFYSLFTLGSSSSLSMIFQFGVFRVSLKFLSPDMATDEVEYARAVWSCSLRLQIRASRFL